MDRFSGIKMKKRDRCHVVAMKVGCCNRKKLEVGCYTRAKKVVVFKIV